MASWRDAFEQPAEPESSWRDAFNMDFLTTGIPTQPETQAALGQSQERFLATVGPIVGQTFDLLQRGQYASANIAESLLSGDLKGIPAAAWSGLTGEQKGSYIDILNERAPGIPQWLRSGLGFALDVGLDPSTYLSFGTAALGRGAAEAGGRSLVRFAGRSLVPESVNKVVFEGLDEAIRAVKGTKAGRWINTVFSSKGRMPDEEFWRLYQDARDEANYLILQARRSNVPLEQALKDVEESLGIPREVITDLVERPVITKTEYIPYTPEEMLSAIRVPTGAREVTRTVERLPGQPEQVRTLAEELIQHQQDRVQKEIAAGVGIRPFESSEIEYFLHRLTPEARAALQRAESKGTFSVRRLIDAQVQHPSTKERTFLRDMSINDVNRIGQEEELIPGYRGKIFEDNPAVIELTRDMMSARSIAAANFIRQVADNPDWARPVAEEGFRALNSATQKRFGPLVEGKFFRSDVAEALEGYVKEAFDPEAMSKFLRAYDSSLGLWKTITLGFSPAWLRNNLMGNVWNGVVLAGAHPRSLLDAFKVFRDPEGLSKVSGMTNREIIDLAERHGVLYSGLYGAEAERAFRDVLGTRTIPQQAAEAVTAPMFAANRAAENWSRLGLFIDGLERGMDPQDAALRVKKYLFDYGDLSDTERQVFKRIAPFYTWYRKNIPLQVEAFITTPGRQAVLPKAMSAATSGQETLQPGASLPEYMQSGLNVPVGTDEKGNIRYLPLRGVPLADLLESMHDISQGRFVEAVNPVVANPLLSAFAATQGFSAFQGREIPETEQGQILPGVYGSARTAEALGNLFPPLSVLNRLTQPRQSVYTPEVNNMVRFLTGMTARNPVLDVMFTRNRLERQASELQAQWKMARAVGDKARADRILQQINDLAVEYAVLLQQMSVLSPIPGQQGQ